jgi:hypothetical protein
MPPVHPPPRSFFELLYRYWFYGWLFRDVNHGNRFERLVAWRHNQYCARWLPTYLLRWTVLGLSFAMMGGLANGLLVPMGAPAALEALLFLPSIVSVSVDAVTLAAWVGLKTLPAP